MSDIRRATAGDAGGVAVVHCQSHAEAYRPIFGESYTGPGVAQRTAHWQQRLELGDTMFVAIDGGKIVGFTHGQEEPDGSATLTTLYLLEAFHRRGIGRDLMARLLAHLHERGYTEAQMDCLLKNERSIAFYKSQGAREIGRQESGLREDVRFVISTQAGSQVIST